MASGAWTYTDKPWPKLPVRSAPEWATFIKTRSPEFKVHSTFGHAKNALRGAGHGICYRWIESLWHPVAVIDCELTVANGRGFAVVVVKPIEFFEPGFKPTEIIYQFVIQEAP